MAPAQRTMASRGSGTLDPPRAKGWRLPVAVARRSTSLAAFALSLQVGRLDAKEQRVRSVPMCQCGLRSSGGKMRRDGDPQRFEGSYGHGAAGWPLREMCLRLHVR